MAASQAVFSNVEPAHADTPEKLVWSQCNVNCGGRCIFHWHTKDGKIQYMTTDDMVNKFAGGAPTALKSGLPEAADTDSLHAAAVTMFNGKTGMASAVQDALNQTARGVLFASVKDVVTGTLAPEEAIETALATPLADS